MLARLKHYILVFYIVKKDKRILIIGGAGFIGINSARHFMDRGWSVTILDNFSRIGTDLNLKWLSQDYPGKFSVIRADITKDLKKLEKAVESNDAVLHLAAQVAVTTSVVDPRNDFNINALGAFNVLEAIRKSKNKPKAIYSSTNKVYGGLEDLKIREVATRYRFKNISADKYGISETRSLDFHSPYGCSKGSADQYFIDYARIYGLKTTVLRQSCIYGPFQFGIEDQGWVAWFSIAGTLNRPIKIYGTGKQVRDILHVSDLVQLYEMVLENMEKSSGVYNVGGGSANTLSLLELIDYLENILGKKLNLSFHDPRPGDQPIFVSDIRKARKDFKWSPKYSPKKGVENIVSWVSENRDVFKRFFK